MSYPALYWKYRQATHLASNLAATCRAHMEKHGFSKLTVTHAEVTGDAAEVRARIGFVQLLESVAVGSFKTPPLWGLYFIATGPGSELAIDKLFHGWPD